MDMDPSDPFVPYSESVEQHRFLFRDAIELDSIGQGGYKSTILGRGAASGHY